MSKNAQPPVNKEANGQDLHNPTETTAPLFNVHSIYVKDLSFEAPHSPQIFNTEWKPKIDFDLQMGSQILSEPESIYEVVLHVTVTIKLGEAAEEKPAFLIDIQQAGAFSVQNFTPEATQQLLATTCATVLFPYARETVSNLVTRGGFPQLVLPPINFDAMYEHHLKTRDTSAEPSVAESH
ncbi:MAG TPA: protein-export chaperone SecB [Gammaproteobacteria bacterium]|nr:protein-export chaperone SecB [Gammaproteobacteria bacterium]